MRKIIFSLSVFFLLSIFGLSALTLSQNPNYKIQGNVDEKYNGLKVYLAKLNDTRSDLQKLDSTSVVNGKYDFEEGLPNNHEVRFIIVDSKDFNQPTLLTTEKGSIKIDYKNDVPTISGTTKNNELQQFLTEQIKIQKEIQEMINSNTDQVSELEAKDLNTSIESLYRKTANNRYKYIQDNIQNDLGEFILLTSLEIIPPDSILNLLSETRSSLKNSDLGIDLVNYYTPLIAKLLGAKYTDLTLDNTKGVSVKLSDYMNKGNIVLLDFWASWCGPCIKEMPELVKIYNEYKNKGFEIIGLSFDDSKSSWLNAIDRLKMTWPQLSDLRGWESVAGKVYGIKSIPTTLLIDKEGKIIGSNIKGDELRSTLNELLNTK